MANADVVLEAIGRASPLTIRGIEGILAEASFAMDVAPMVKGISVADAPPNTAYDFLLGDLTPKPAVRMQVKMQRRKSHRPWMANEVYKNTRQWPPDFFVVEVQRTRAGSDGKGGSTRPYKFGDFDLLGVSLGAARGKWSDFVYTVANWLIPDPADATWVLKFQPVAPGDNEDWTSDLKVAMGWVRERKLKQIRG